MGCFPACSMDQSMERVWISAGGAGLGPLKHSWAGGGERNFPAHSVGDFSQLCFPVQGGHGLRHCLSSSWIKDLSVNHQSLINPHGFIAAFRDGCVGALSTANKIVLVLLSEECAGEGRMWEFCLFWSQSLAPAWTLLSVCSFQPLPSENGNHPAWSRSFSLALVLC